MWEGATWHIKRTHLPAGLFWSGLGSNSIHMRRIAVNHHGDHHSRYPLPLTYSIARHHGLTTTTIPQNGGSTARLVTDASTSQQ